MRAWLYDHLVTDPDLQDQLGGVEKARDRVIPRRSEESIVIPKPFIVYGLGNSTNEDLEDATANDAVAERQFLQMWVHDEGGSYTLIDNLLGIIRRRLVGASHPPSRVLTIRYLETSAEFNNQTYNTIFRYMRLQAILAEGRTLT